VHEPVSVSAGHAVPPFVAAVTTLRVRVRVPVLVAHLDQADHADTVQFVGVGILHADVSERHGHSMPPYIGLTVILRVRVEVSVTALHEDQELHVPTWQLTGSHAAVSVRAGQVAPR
jgi:hypothetical protein